MLFNNIPQELREFRQWLVWKYENRGETKKTKTPYSAITAKIIDITDPLNLCSFEQAIVSSQYYDGIGFSLMPDDPFCFVDFDSTQDQAEIEFQKQVLTAFDSYSEISPSGSGLHIICKATLPTGRRYKNTEIYTSGRYMAMTGNVYENKSIAYRQTLASQLWDTLGTSVYVASDHNGHSDKNDLQIYNMAQYAENGEKFLKLWNGDIYTWHLGDHSRADFALVDIIAFYTQDRQQVKRLFRQSGLGQRQKAKREDYCENMISRAFDRIIPEVNIDELLNRANEFIASQPKQAIVKIAEEKISIENLDLFPREIKPIVNDPATIHIPKNIDDGAFTIPPGLMGQIAKFIYDQSYKPIPEIAIVGAMGFLAGIAGRAYNVSANGLNMYLLLLAGTGRGKEAIASGVNKIIKSVQPLMPTIIDFMGPQDVASGQALLRHMSNHPTKSFVSIMGEFGIKLKQICDPRAFGADLMTQKVMLDMYSKSGIAQTIMPTVYSDVERNTKAIDSPAFSLIGESAPTWFYNALDEGWIRTGLLPRFTVVEYLGKRPPSNEDCDKVIPSQSLIQNVCSLATAVYKIGQTNVPYPIPFSKEAMVLSRALDKQCDDLINDNNDDIVAELWSRCHLKTIRLAALIAVGINPFAPIIDFTCFEWAEKFIKFGTEKLSHKFENGIPCETSMEASQLKIVIQYLVRYFSSDDWSRWKSYGITPKMFATKVITNSFFTSKCAMNKTFYNDKIGPTGAAKRAIQNLLDNGDLQEIPKNQASRDYGFSGRLYAITSNAVFEAIKDKMHLLDD